MADVVQRYTHAAVSTNLKVDEHHVDADVLMAIAMSGGLASPMVRVKYLNDPAAYKALLAAWRGIVVHKASLRKWPEQINPVTVAKASLDYWLADQCSRCNGTGFPLLKGIPTRSTKACSLCDGSGLMPISCPRQYREQALDMYQELCSIFDKARERCKRKLKG